MSSSSRCCAIADWYGRIDGSFADGCSMNDVEDMKRAADSKAVTRVATMLATTLQQNKYYKERLDNLVKYAVPSFEHGPQIQELTAKLEKSPLKPSLKVVQDGVYLFLEVAGKVNPPFSDGLNTLLMSTLAKVAADCNAMLGQGAELSWGCSDLEQVISLLQAALGESDEMHELAMSINAARQKENAQATVRTCAEIATFGSLRRGIRSPLASNVDLRKREASDRATRYAYIRRRGLQRHPRDDDNFLLRSTAQCGQRRGSPNC